MGFQKRLTFVLGLEFGQTTVGKDGAVAGRIQSFSTKVSGQDHLHDTRLGNCTELLCGAGFGSLMCVTQNSLSGWAELISQALLSLFLKSLSEYAPRTFIHYEKIMHQEKLPSTR